MRHFSAAVVSAAFIAVGGLGCGSHTPAPEEPQPPLPDPPTVQPDGADSVCNGGATRPASGGATRLTASQARERYGQSADKFSDVESSMKKPIEVCGVRGQLEWLMVARCDNTTNPFRTSADAHQSRAGSLGAGGQCGHVIDLYKVACPEKTYEVYMDLYMCGPGEDL